MQIICHRSASAYLWEVFQDDGQLVVPVLLSELDLGSDGIRSAMVDRVVCSCSTCDGASMVYYMRLVATPCCIRHAVRREMGQEERGEGGRSGSPCVCKKREYA